VWPSMHDMTAKWIPQNERSKFVSAYLGKILNRCDYKIEIITFKRFYRRLFIEKFIQSTAVEDAMDNSTCKNN